MSPPASSGLFQAIPSGEDYQIKNIYTNKCLAVAGQSQDNGAPIEQATCSGETHQLFEARAAPGGTYQLVSRSSGKCLNVRDRSTENGARIQQWTCAPYATNMIFEAAPPSYVKPPYECSGVLCDGTP